MSFLPTIVYASTLEDQKARVMAAASGTNNSVKLCPQLGPTAIANWGLFYAALTAFFQEDPGIWGWGSRYERGEAYENELTAWQEKLQASGCALAVPIVHPPPQADLTKIAQYAAWGAGFLAVAYVVGKVTEFLPHPAPRSSPSMSVGQHAARMHGHMRRLLRA